VRRKGEKEGLGGKTARWLQETGKKAAKGKNFKEVGRKVGNEEHGNIRFFKSWWQ